MTLFSFDFFAGLGDALLKNPLIQKGEFNVSRYAGGELAVRIHTNVRDEVCCVLGSISPPDVQLLSLLLLAHTLKKEGARKVVAVLPYLAYARHDKDKPGESLSTQCIGQLLAAAGVDEVLTVDVHSERDRQLFPIPIISLSPEEIFAKIILDDHLLDSTLIAPDEGSRARCEDVRRQAGIHKEGAYFKKKRTANGVTQEGPIGSVGQSAIIIDDMLDTGGTLVEACQKLRQSGVTTIFVMVSHGLFTGDAWKVLWDLGVERIYCTDSIPTQGIIDPRISSISISDLLGNSLQKYDAEELVGNAKEMRT